MVTKNKDHFDKWIIESKYNNRFKFSNSNNPEHNQKNIPSNKIIITIIVAL